jgi:hypothetical protein
VNLWAGFSPLMMETGEPMSTRSVIRALVDAVERSHEAVLPAGRTLPDRRANAHEAFWQHVQEEAAQEADGVECHDALLAAGGIIAPAEADALTASS